MARWEIHPLRKLVGLSPFDLPSRLNQWPTLPQSELETEDGGVAVGIGIGTGAVSNVTGFDGACLNIRKIGNPCEARA